MTLRIAPEVVAAEVPPEGTLQLLGARALFGLAVCVLEVVALGLAFGSWVSAFVVVAILGFAFAQRIHVEEAELSRALGEPYRAYARETARLVPGVW
jgi:protein-S-isoprenylcysteine O-methyltransferase Ste14